MNLERRPTITPGDKDFPRLNMETFTNLEIVKAEETKPEPTRIQRLKDSPVTSNQIEKAVEDGKFETIEKALGSLRYSSTIKFKKTGKQIKDQLNKIEGKIESRITDLRSGLKKMEEAIGFAPTDIVNVYEGDGLKDGQGDDLRRYNYNLEYYQSAKSNLGMTDFTTDQHAETQKMTCASTEDQAKAVREYNSNIYKLMQCMKDYNIVEAMENNMDDKAVYELGVEQIMELGF